MNKIVTRIEFERVDGVPYDIQFEHFKGLIANNVEQKGHIFLNVDLKLYALDNRHPRKYVYNATILFY